MELITYSPFVIGTIGLFVSFWLNRIQPLLLVLSIVLLNAILLYFMPVGEESIAQSVLFPIVSFLLPLNLFLWAVFPERGVRNNTVNSFVIAALALQVLFVYYFMSEMPLAWLAYFSAPVVEGVPHFHLPFASTIVFLLAGFFISIKLINQKQIRVFGHSLLFILLLMAFALNQHLNPGFLPWISSIAVLIILLALIFDSHHIAYTDELTGLLARRALNESFMSLGKRYSIAMIDIDHFKQFNDTYGHDMGDDVLKMVAGVIGDVKAGGEAYRYGGEEFTLVFKNKTLDKIQDELERIREVVAAEVIEIVPATKGKKKTSKTKPKIKKLNVTISIGAAQAQKNLEQPEQVLKYADEGLYKAKKAGRNKVVLQPEVKPATKSKSRAKKASGKPTKKK